MQLSSLSLGPYPYPELCLVILIYTDLPVQCKKRKLEEKDPKCCLLYRFLQVSFKGTCSHQLRTRSRPLTGWVVAACHQAFYLMATLLLLWSPRGMLTAGGCLAHDAHIKVDHLSFFCSKSEQSTAVKSRWLLWFLWPNIKFYCTL